MFFLSFSSNDDQNVKREKISAFVSGVILAIGWWILIDAAYTSTDPFGIPFKYQLPMYFSLISIILLNSFPWSALIDPIDMAFAKAKLIFFISMLNSFGCIIAQIWILSDIFSNTNKTNETYPGIAMVLNTICIFFSAIILRYGSANKNTL